MKTQPIIDVNSFFETIIEKYTQFSDLADLLATEMRFLKPESIEIRCQQLSAERQRLTELDEQLIEIIDLAGNELTFSNHITRYRVAFSSASLAIEKIHSQLLHIRQSYEEVTHH